jgi:exo-1,4-beta-D-glucosaminidase
MRRILVILSFLGASTAVAAAEPAGPSSLLLREGWALESSAQVKADGRALSTPGFAARGWYRATLPSTVVSALVSARVLEDPYTGTNLRSMPGASYPVASNFSNVPMPPDSPFKSSWWYRNEFQAPSSFAGRTLRLRFDGINYRANVWLNGERIAASDRMAGPWRVFELEVTRFVRPGQANALAVEVFPPQPEDLAITFVDWNPQPPDKNMGLWRDVSLMASGPVALRWPHVVTKLELPRYERAELTVSAELRNDSELPVEGVLKGQIEGSAFSQPVKLAARESRVVVFTPADFAQLKLAHPRVWWPAPVGPQELYRLRLEFTIGATLSDSATIRFGVRDVASFLDEKQHRRFRINGRDILIRGAGYSFDMLLRSTPEKQEAELRYVRDMNLNAIRLEGKIEDEHFLDLCDEYGILVLAGWCCCDHWERWADWDDEDRLVAQASLEDQVRRLRSHASVISWMNGSDYPPPPEIERAYLGILERSRWPNAVVSSATERVSSLTGGTGVQMTGPYEYVAPSYWLLERGKLGGAHGFNTETSCGPALPPIESLKKMLPEDHLWPIDSVWGYHAGGGVFQDLHVFTEAMDARYGKAAGLEDYSRKAQVMAYEGHRAMFEAYGRNKYGSTGVIQWLLNNSWPSLIWHLYDWYLRPGGSYFGTKKACEPLHVQYSYDDASVVVVNSYYRAVPGLEVRARVLNLDMTEKLDKRVKIDVSEDSSTRVFTIPALTGLTRTYFLRLDLRGADGRELSSNLYWLSTKKEELDWERSTWYHTPTKVFDDLTDLTGLPRVELRVDSASEVTGSEGTTRVRIENPSPHIAFFVRLKVNRSGEMVVEGPNRIFRNGEEILPVLWQDNDFSLLPGEKREIVASYRVGEGESSRPVVEVEGWNVPNRSYETSAAGGTHQ